jgi:hypothetical protein
MTHRLARPVASVSVAVAVLVAATACSAGSPSATGTARPHATSSGKASSGARETPAPTPSRGPLSCDTLITADTVAALKKQGWVAQQRDFSFGPNVVAGGLECLWADPSTTSDHGLLYGWAPISASDAAAREAQLVSSGWVREDSDRGVYITADPRTTLSTDDQGYGMTYLFGDGWVTVSDTKQGLVLITAQG